MVENLQQFQIRILNKLNQSYSLNNRSNNKNLKIYEERLKNDRLEWCKQIIKICRKKHHNKMSINDIGCNYFQLYKEIKYQKLKFNYFGYDTDKTFIQLGLKKFPELKSKYKIQNISNTIPRTADASIISAVLEHVERPYDFLKNCLKSSKKIILLRTHISSFNKIELTPKNLSMENQYLINEFSKYAIRDIFKKYCFKCEEIEDKYTNYSRPYKLHKYNLKRKFVIFLGTKLY